MADAPVVPSPQVPATGDTAAAPTVTSANALAAPVAPAADPVQTQAPEQAPPQQPTAEDLPGTLENTLSPGGMTRGALGDAFTDVGEGMLESGFQASDFLFGKPTERGPVRTAIEGDLEAQRRKSGFGSGEEIGAGVNSFTANAAQFTAGMIGVGKVTGLTRIAAEAPVVGKAAIEAVKAGITSAVAFDPHQKRLSDLVEQFPQLTNPVSRFLASKPGDSDAMGRLKNGLESLGITGALEGVLRSGIGLFKAVKGGASPEEVAQATQEAAQAVDDHTAATTPQEPAATPAASTEAPAAPTETPGAPTEPVPQAPGEQPAATPKAVDSADAVGNTTSAEVQAVDTPSGSPGEQAASAHTAPGETPAKPPVDVMSIPEDSLQTIIRGAHADETAIMQYGSWDDAVDNGHVFSSQGSTLPWGVLASDPEQTGILLARIAETMQPELAAMKGGEVLGDAALLRQVSQRLQMYNVDTADFMGALQKAGSEAATMVSNMEAGFTVAQRGLQDAYTLAARIRGGFVDDVAAAHADLKAMVEVATTAYGNARSILANAGRAVRRSGFALDPETVARLKGMDGDALAALLSETEGDPRNLSRLANQSLWGKIVDWGTFMNANNLLWSWRTSAVNLMGNAFMLATRPLGRAIGGAAQEMAGNAAGGAIRQAALKQYVYMGSSILDSWNIARRAFSTGDSILIPHRSEQGAVNSRFSMGSRPWRSWDSVSNIGYNALVAAIPRAISVPGRALGAVEEMTKQIAYRSYVQANAFVEGQENGLSGAALDQFVSDTLDGAFDQAGRATDAAARQEALLSAHQQDLLPGTLGKGVQNFVTYLPMFRLVLPFVKTPTNLIRYGIKLSPVLNLASKEYRNMLFGSMGPEQQANAIGQMTMGTLFAGTAALLSAHGKLTGGGPSDPKLKSQLMATGWRPYSAVSDNPDGTKTYTQMNRMDPMAVPLGIVADLHDAMNIVGPDHAGVQQGIASLGIAMAKQVTNKMYFQTLAQTLDGLMQPDHKLQGVVGGLASNLVPMSSLLRNTNPDPYMREARTVVDKVMATIPGLSDKLPAKYDAWGDPVTVRPQFTAIGNKSVVDNEMDRMITETGQGFEPPSPTVNHADLRDVTMADGTNAYEKYQQLAGHLPNGARSLKSIVGLQMQTHAYQNAPDGPADARGSKQWIVAGTIQKYRAKAMQVLKGDPQVRAALQAADKQVRDAYVAQQKGGTSAPPTAGMQLLGNLGKAFGMNSGGAQPPAQQ